MRNFLDKTSNSAKENPLATSVLIAHAIWLVILLFPGLVGQPVASTAGLGVVDHVLLYFAIVWGAGMAAIFSVACALLIAGIAWLVIATPIALIMGQKA